MNFGARNKSAAIRGSIGATWKLDRHRINLGILEVDRRFEAGDPKGFRAEPGDFYRLIAADLQDIARVVAEGVGQFHDGDVGGQAGIGAAAAVEDKGDMRAVWGGE